MHKTQRYLWFPRRSKSHRPLGFNVRGIYTIANLLSNKTVYVSHLEDRQLLHMRSSKVVAMCIFNTLQAAGLFLVLDGTSGRKYRKLENNAVFIHNESLFIVSAAATSAFQLKHTPRLLCSICPVGYQIRTIRYGKILVMLLYGKYIGRYTRYIKKDSVIVSRCNGG